jgi:putative FmdB family regulatory protein
MPLYEYECRSCGKVSEFLVREPKDIAENRCPACGSRDLERQMSVPSVLRDRTDTRGATCCGRTERCEKPPCSAGGACHRS